MFDWLISYRDWLTLGQTLTPHDVVSVAFFFLMWIGYARFAIWYGRKVPSLQGVMDVLRRTWALRMVDAPEELEARQEQLAELVALHGQPRGAGFRWAEERAKQFRGGEQALVFAMLELWQSWWRDLLLTAAGCDEAIIHVDRRDELRYAAARYPLAEAHAFITRLAAAARQLRENVNPQLALENLALHLPQAR